MHAPAASILEFGDFRLDPARRLLLRADGTQVQLTSRVFDTLAFLVEHPDTVLDKERIMEAVWPDSIVEENNLAQAISKLRQVLGEKPGAHQFIVTVPGRGYRFVAEVRSFAGKPDEPKGDVVAPAEQVAAQDRSKSGNETPLPSLRPYRRRVTVVVALVTAMLAGLFLWRTRTAPNLAARATVASPFIAANEKSIAVLPFDNLSDEKENTYFAVAVQDEILTDLAQIADLKVISRISADTYAAGQRRNAREIGRQLGVAHLLEGSVQRKGDHIRVHAQLVDTRSDSHVWAQTYDREVGDIFALQTEISKAIAQQLRAKISPREKAAIEQQGTSDVIASTLYAEARRLEGWTTTLRAIELLEQAVARDPNFALAYCELVKCHVYLYFGSEEHTPARLGAAEAALQAALRLQPDSGEVRLAAATYAFLGLSDYDRARAEVELARRSLPNSPDVYRLIGQLDRRQGRWNESLRNFERAAELEPRSYEYITPLAVTEHWLRNYPKAAELYARSCELEGIDRASCAGAAIQPVLARGDLTQFHAASFRILQKRSPQVAALNIILHVALLERDVATIERAIAMLPKDARGIQGFGFPAPEEWFAACTATARGDSTGARAFLQVARENAESAARQHAELSGAWATLSRIDAALGRKEEAIDEAQRACELRPLSKDAMYAPSMITNLAAVYAALGERDRALEQLTLSAQLPGGVHYGELKLDPTWDTLRSDGRFEQIVASLAPK